MADGTFLAVVPGQIRRLWCARCMTHSGLEVGVYVMETDGVPDLVGTFTGCTACDPDLFQQGTT